MSIKTLKKAEKKANREKKVQAKEKPAAREIPQPAYFVQPDAVYYNTWMTGYGPWFL